MLQVANELSMVRAENWPLGLATKTAIVMLRGAVWTSGSQSVVQKGTGEEKYSTGNMESNLKSLAIQEKRKMVWQQRTEKDCTYMEGRSHVCAVVAKVSHGGIKWQSRRDAVPCT